MSAQRETFTLDELDWKAWLPPVPFDEATESQRAVVKEAWPGAEKSEFFTLLVREPEILRHRMKLLNGIMYAPKGLPRADRELGATAESKLNGCVYCASVHGKLHAQLTKSSAVIETLFKDGVEAPFEGRTGAVVRYAARLSTVPPSADASDIAALKKEGLSNTEILDLTQAVAIFAWANRLMLTLGEPADPL